MLDYKEIDISLKKAFESRAPDARFSCYRFPNIYMYRDDLNIKYIEIDDSICPIVRVNSQHEYCLFPFGAHDLGSTVRKLMEFTGGKDILPISETMKNRLEQACPDMFSYEHTRANDDYIYDAEELRTLPGKKYHSKRNFASRFYSAHSHEYIELTAENLDLCDSVLEKWFEVRRTDVIDERRAIGELFQNFEALKLRGAALRIGGQIAAFTIGELIEDDTAHILIEKADISHVGVYAAINRDFLVNAFPSVLYVNREEDMGILGLRRAKQSYHPIRMGTSYFAHFLR